MTMFRKFIFITSLSLLIASCGSDDDKESVKSNFTLNNETVTSLDKAGCTVVENKMECEKNKINQPKTTKYLAEIEASLAQSTEKEKQLNALLIQLKGKNNWSESSSKVVSSLLPTVEKELKRAEKEISEITVAIEQEKSLLDFVGYNCGESLIHSGDNAQRYSFELGEPSNIEAKSNTKKSTSTFSYDFQSYGYKAKTSADYDNYIKFELSKNTDNERTEVAIDSSEFKLTRYGLNSTDHHSCTKYGADGKVSSRMKGRALKLRQYRCFVSYGAYGKSEGDRITNWFNLNADYTTDSGSDLDFKLDKNIVSYDEVNGLEKSGELSIRIHSFMGYINFEISAPKKYITKLEVNAYNTAEYVSIYHWEKEFLVNIDCRVNR